MKLVFGRVLARLFRYGLDMSCGLVVVLLAMRAYSYFVRPLLLPYASAMSTVALIGLFICYFGGLGIVFFWPAVFRVEGRSWLERHFDERSGIDYYFPSTQLPRR